MATATIVTKAQFHDLDPMNVVWHGNHVRYLEHARTELMEQLGFSYREMQASGYLWPIVDLRVKYIRPIHFGRTFSVEASLVEIENRLRIDYRIRDQKTDEILAKATTIQVAVNASNGELCLEVPAEVVAILRARS
jgi:acyl-CoA thioester hydrolase